jgi:hypothetical protein|nr:hypothetical protein [Neorhizobium tomejilense]
MIDQQTIDRIAAAIKSADIGHSMTLTRLVDGVHTYTLTIDGKVEEFVDNDEDAIDQVYARIREVKHLKQAEAVISALGQPAEGRRGSYVIGPNTMAKVLQPAGLDDLGDLQAVLDAVELAFASSDNVPTKRA